MTNLTSQNTNQDTNKAQNMKNVLFLVTGMTPQIITETVWALACDPDNEEPWIPDEIYVLSTEYGLNQIKKRLFEDGVFEQMKTDFPHLANTIFDESKLIAIVEGQETYTDIKTPHDNEVMANVLCREVRELTKEDDVSLHVSIAGGRKTMGFYAGYALSLYGRAQDRLSHVLVEEQFERANNFFYPTPYSKLVSDRDEKVVGDAKDAQIWLAQIPFVRMKQAIKEKHQLNRDDSLIEVVNKINESFNDVTLQLLLHKSSIVVNDTYTVKLPAREFAFLHWFADSRKLEPEGILAPSIKSDSQTQLYISELTSQFVGYYEQYKFSKKAEESLEDIVMDRKYFDEVKSRLKTCLQENLGLELSANIEITQNGRGKPFYLNLDVGSITIEDGFNKQVQ